VLLNMPKNKGIPEDTVKVKSGKGYHVYMRHPGFYVNNKVNLALTIDIRADGGLIAAPPSMHGSGHQYQWSKGFLSLKLTQLNVPPG